MTREGKEVRATVGRAAGPLVTEQAMDAWVAGSDDLEWWFGNGDEGDAAS
ncbi:hypothetical protein [Streptomyces sp. NPDC005017]